jgi:hypothetical protein
LRAGDRQSYFLRARRCLSQDLLQISGTNSKLSAHGAGVMNDPFKKEIASHHALAGGSKARAGRSGGDGRLR